MVDLAKSLSIAIGQAALAKHLESCEVCSDEHACKVAQAHRRMLRDLADEHPEATS